MKLNRQRVVSTALGLLVAGAAGAGVSQCNQPPPAPTPTPAPTCLGDPSASINAVPAGGIWNGDGNCYTVPSGVRIPSDITVENATFEDPTNVNPGGYGPGPIVYLKDVSNVSLVNVAVVGSNTTGKLDGTLVGIAGFLLKHATNVNLTNDSATNVWGDCLEAWASPPKDVTPSSQVHVEGFTGTACGRDGISPSDITNSTFDHLTFVKPNPNAYMLSIDAESDLAGVGGGNLTFSNCQWTGGVIWGEALTGPVTFSGCNFGTPLLRARVTTPYAITVSDSTIQYGSRSTPHLNVSNMNLVLDHDTVVSGGGDGIAYNVTNGGHLSLISTPLPPPAGYADPTSTVSVAP